MRRVVKVSRIRIIITIIVVVLTTLLTGCTGKEPNEIAYVVALGIDSTDDDNYKITIQYANTTQISGGASESGGKAGSEIVDNVTIEAPNIYAGVGLANNIVSKSFSMSHAKLIVFSKEMAEKGVKDMIETLVRSEEIRPDVFIAVANTTANDYLTSVNPEMEVNPAQYYQLIYQKNQLVGIPDGQLREFFTGLYTDNYDSILPVSGVIEGAGGNSQNDDKGQSKDSQNEGSEGSSESLDSFESKNSDEIFDRFCDVFWQKENINNELKNKAKDLLKQIIMAIPIFHDIGKVNPNFQLMKLKVNDFKENKAYLNTHHSLLSSMFYIDYCRKLIYDEKNEDEIVILLAEFILYNGYIIARHHSKLGRLTEFIDLIRLDNDTYFFKLKQIVNNEDIYSVKVDFIESDIDDMFRNLIKMLKK